MSSNLFPSNSRKGQVNNSLKDHSYSFGGLKTQSTAIFIAFYTIVGMISLSISQPVSKQGFVLISISQGSIFSSIIKSYPNI